MSQGSTLRVVIPLLGLVLLVSRTAAGYKSASTSYSAADDQPEQRSALLSIRDALQGTGITDELLSWGGNDSYCLWPRITCCRDTPAGLLRRPCAAPHDVAALDLTACGLSSSSGPPPALARLPALAQLLLCDNQQMLGVWPEALLLPALSALEVQGTGLTFCQEAPAVVEVGQVTTATLITTSTTPPTQDTQQQQVVANPPCRLPQWLQQSLRAPLLSGPDGLACPQLLLVNRTGASSGGGGRGPWPLGPVTADPAAFQWGGCTCPQAQYVLTAVSGSQQLVPPPQAAGASAAEQEAAARQQVAVASVRWLCVDPDEAALNKALKEGKFTLGLAWVLGGLLLWPLLWFPTKYFWKMLLAWLQDNGARHPGTKPRGSSHPGSSSGRGLLQEGELSLAAKRSRFPGTPSVALAKGRGLVTLADVMVTWVVTDVEGSTRLWEENAPAMAEAVELHNKVMRGLLPEYGGHEVRTDGDSFTLAFHDAIDAVEYCLRAQELLLHVPWPEALLAHDYGRPVYLGEACSGIPLLQPQAAGAAAAGRAATSGRLSFVLGAEGVPGGPSATGTARQARGEAQQQQQALCVPPNMELRWEGGGSEDGGDVAGGRDTALAGLRQRGPLLFRGLRVRMGINTGIPDDIYVHDLTDAVEYRGREYELAGDLGDMAAGGQILLGPRTFQRWNKVFQQGATEQGPAVAEDTSNRGTTATGQTGTAAAEPVLSGAGDTNLKMSACKQKSRRFCVSSKLGNVAGHQEPSLGPGGALVQASGYSLALSSNYASFTTAGMAATTAVEGAVGAASGPSWTAAGATSRGVRSGSGSGISFMMSPAAALLEGAGGQGGSGELVVVRRSASASGVQLQLQQPGHRDSSDASQQQQEGRRSLDGITTSVTLSGARGRHRSSSSNSSQSGDVRPPTMLRLTRSRTISSTTASNTGSHATLLHPALAAASGKVQPVKVPMRGRSRSSSLTAAVSLGGGLVEAGTPKIGGAWNLGAAAGCSIADSISMAAPSNKLSAEGFKQRLSLLVVAGNEPTPVMSAATHHLAAAGAVDAAAYVKPAVGRKRSASTTAVASGVSMLIPTAGALGSGGGGSGGWTIPASYSCDAEVAGVLSGSGSGRWSPGLGNSHEGEGDSEGGVALSPHLTSRQEVSSEWGQPTQHQTRRQQYTLPYTSGGTRTLTLDGDDVGERPAGLVPAANAPPEASHAAAAAVGGTQQLLEASPPITPSGRRHRSILVVPGLAGVLDAGPPLASPRRANRSVCFAERPATALSDLYSTSCPSPSTLLGGRVGGAADGGGDSPLGRTRSLGLYEVTARPGVGGAGSSAGSAGVTYLRRTTSSDEASSHEEEERQQGSNAGGRRLRHLNSRTALAGSGSGGPLLLETTPEPAMASWEQPSGGGVVTVPLLGSGGGMVVAAPTGRHVPRSKRRSSWVSLGLAAGPASPAPASPAGSARGTSSTRSSGEEQQQHTGAGTGRLQGRPVGEGGEGSRQSSSELEFHAAVSAEDMLTATGLMQLPLPPPGQQNNWDTQTVSTSLMRLESAAAAQEEGPSVVQAPAAVNEASSGRAPRASPSLLQDHEAPESHGHDHRQSLLLSRGSTWTTNPSSEGGATATAHDTRRPHHASVSQTVLTVLEESPSSGSGSGSGTVARPRASGVWNWLRRSTVGTGAPSAGGNSQQSGPVTAGWRSWAGMGVLRSSMPAGHGARSRAGMSSGSGRSYREGRASLSRMREDAHHVRALLAEQQGDSTGSGGIDEEVVLMDLGYYQWQEEEGEPEDGAAEEAGQPPAALRVLHLAQVMSAALMGRLRLFPWPLPAATGEDALLRQLLPGFWDAPGAGALQSPEMRQLLEGAAGPGSRPARPQVAIVFVCPAGLKTLAAFSQPLAQLCIRIFNATLREVLLAVGGYESKENGGLSMLAFDSPAAALEWALTFQLALLEVPWPEQLLELQAGAQVTAPFCPDPSALSSLDGNRMQPPLQSHSTATSERSMQKRLGQSAVTTAGENPAAAAEPEPTPGLGGSGPLPSATGALELLGAVPGEEVVLFRGLRARIGVWSGPMDRVVPHSKTGRADYLGQPANRAARLMAAAQGGQILVEQGLGEAVVAAWRRQAAGPRATSSSRSTSSLFQPSSRGTFSTVTGRTSTSSSWWATNPGGRASGVASVPGVPSRVSLVSPYVAAGNSVPLPVQLPGGLAPGALTGRAVTKVSPKVSPMVSPRPSEDLGSSRAITQWAGVAAVSPREPASVSSPPTDVGGSQDTPAPAGQPTPAPIPQPLSVAGGRSAAVSSAGASSASFNVMVTGMAAAEADSSSSQEGLSPEEAAEAAEEADSLGGLRLAYTCTQGEEGDEPQPHHPHRHHPTGSRASHSSNGAMPRWRSGGSLSGDGSMRAGLDPAARRAVSSNGSSGAGAEMGEGSMSGGLRRGRRRRTHDPDPLLVAWYNAAAASGVGSVESASGVKDLGASVRSSSGAGGLPVPLSPAGGPARPLLVDLVPVDYDPTRFTLRAANSPTSSAVTSNGAAARPMLPVAGAQCTATLLGSSSNGAGAGLGSKYGEGGLPSSPRTAARAGLFSRLSSSWRGSGAGSSTGGQNDPAPVSPAPVAEGVEPDAQDAPAAGGRHPGPAVDVTSVLQALGSWDMGATGPGAAARALQRQGSSGSSGSPSPRSMSSSSRRSPGRIRSWREPDLPLTSPRGGGGVSSGWTDAGPLSPRGVVAPARQESAGEEQEMEKAPLGAAARPVLPRHLRGGAKKRRQNSLAFLINSASAMGPSPGSPPAPHLACINEGAPAGTASSSGVGWEPQQLHPGFVATAGAHGDSHLQVAHTGDADWLLGTRHSSTSTASAARRSRSLDLGHRCPPAAAGDLSTTSWAHHHSPDHHQQQHGPSRLSMDSSSRPAGNRGPAPWAGTPEAPAPATAADSAGARVRRRSALLWGDVPSHVQPTDHSLSASPRQSGAALAASSSLFAPAAMASPGQPTRRLQQSSSANSRGTSLTTSSSLSSTAAAEQLHPPSAAAAMVTRVLNRVRASMDIRPASAAPGTAAATPGGAGGRSRYSRSTTDSAGSSERRSMDMRTMGLPTVPQQEEDSPEAAGAMGTTPAGVPAAAGPAAGASPDSPGVMAECYKLTSAVPAEGEGGATPLQSITMIKYTNLVQQAGSLPGMTDMERHLMEGATIAEEAAAAAVAVPVSLHSLGSFSLKGVPEPVAVAQLVPLVLEGRLCQLLPPHLVNKGKVRCLAHTPGRLATTTVLLPDIHQLACCQPMEEEEEDEGQEEEEEGYNKEAPMDLHQQTASGTSGQVPPHVGVEVGFKAAGQSPTTALVGALPGAAPVAVAQASLAARRRA